MNQVAIMGRFTRDPELRYSQSGKPVAKFTLAVNRYSDNEADFFDCTAFDKQAENISNSCQKGHRLLVWGRLQQDKWTDQQTQQQRTAVKIMVSSFDFIEPASPRQEQADNRPPAGPPSYQSPSPGYQQPGYGQQPGYTPPGPGGFKPPAGPPPGQPGGYPGQGAPPAGQYGQGQPQTGAYHQSPVRPPAGPPPGQQNFNQYQGQQQGFSGNIDDIPF